MRLLFNFKLVDANGAVPIGHEFTRAVELYSEAIENNALDATLWNNRAYARMKLEEFGYALADASACFS